jgi:hypothetical protein
MNLNLSLIQPAGNEKIQMLACFGMSLLTMGLRGPKPVAIGLLTTWEFEFYKAFRSLRDGTPLPIKSSPPTGLSRPELRSFIGRLKQMTPEHYWLTTQRLTAEISHAVNLSRPPLSMDRWWAARQKEDEIHSLRMELNPPGIEALDRRRKIWDDLIEADTYAALRKVCGRWAQLSDVWKLGTTPFPRHVRQNAAAFLSMKQNSRFPRSTYSDDARVDYLARGMAGVLCGVSPMTGIERLRNMKHDRSGSLWVTREGNHALPDGEQRCGCWRCNIERSTKLTPFTRAYENGLKVFMELSTSTKVPIEWRAKRSPRLT